MERMEAGKSCFSSETLNKICGVKGGPVQRDPCREEGQVDKEGRIYILDDLL